MNFWLILLFCVWVFFCRELYDNLSKETLNVPTFQTVGRERKQKCEKEKGHQNAHRWVPYFFGAQRAQWTTFGVWNHQQKQGRLFYNLMHHLFKHFAGERKVIIFLCEFTIKMHKLLFCSFGTRRTFFAQEFCFHSSVVICRGQTFLGVKWRIFIPAFFFSDTAFFFVFPSFFAQSILLVFWICNFFFLPFLDTTPFFFSVIKQKQT